jgi:hypothetical protein
MNLKKPMIKKEWLFMNAERKKEDIIWCCSICGSLNNIKNIQCGKCQKIQEPTDTKY